MLNNSQKELNALNLALVALEAWFDRHDKGDTEMKIHTLSDSTLKTFSKKELIHYIRMIEDNLQGINDRLKNCYSSNRKLMQEFEKDAVKSFETELVEAKIPTDIGYVVEMEKIEGIVNRLLKEIEMEG